MKHRPTAIRDRLGALRGLLRISDDDYNAYMRSYGELFVDSPENTRADYDNGVPLRGYPQGSSNELTELYKVIHLSRCWPTRFSSSGSSPTTSTSPPARRCWS